MLPEKRKDPLTGQEFLPKKKSQRFASPSNRISYNNQKASKVREETSQFDNALRKNFLILKDLMGMEKEKIFYKEFLKGRGFSFNVATHLVDLEEKKYWAVYNFIWTAIGDKIKIRVT